MPNRNIEEIRADPVLRAYGACLAATHLLSFLFWKIGMPLVRILDPAEEAVCWPFWESCHRYRLLMPSGIEGVLWAYFALGIASTVLFSKKDWIPAAWWVFLALNLFKLALVVQDFQLRLNQHYMAGLACLAFLFLPGKRGFLKILIASFYFWAGLLKLNAEWLSGAALYKPVWLFTGAWLCAACVYVVVLEIVLVWGLFFKNRWVFWATLAQLALFHIFSWPVVGFFYPTLMACLLAIYPLDRLLPAAVPVRWRWPNAVFLGVFSLAQLMPHAFPGDPALTGEGRLFGVHMFDALVQCEATAVLKRPDGRTAKKNLHREMAARIHCDPIVYLNRGRNLCESPYRGRDFEDFDLKLKSRRATDSEWTSVIDLRDFCSNRPTYSIWRHNEWIQP